MPPIIKSGFILGRANLGTVKRGRLSLLIFLVVKIFLILFFFGFLMTRL